jgi:hypothetical protein
MTGRGAQDALMHPMAYLLLALGMLATGLALGLLSRIEIPNWSPATIEAAATAGQAVLTVLAITVAIWVPMWQDHLATRRSQRDARLRARSFAMAIFPELIELQVAAKTNFEKLDQRVAAGQTALTMETLHSMTFKLPPILATSIDHTYLLGERVAPMVQSIVAMVNDYERLLHQLIAINAPAAKGFDENRVKETLRERVFMIERATEKACGALGPICQGQVPLSDF